MSPWTLVAAGVVLACASALPADAPPATRPATQPASVLDFTPKNNAGQDAPLAAYKGKVLLIVNTASKCGLTPQYAALEDLYKKYGDQGLAILAFPANDFNRQEPGADPEIRQFCTEKYSVTFDLFSKVVVKGDGQAPLYQFLTSDRTNPQFAGDIQWNFTKFLVSRDGKVVARFEPKEKPDDKKVVEAIEAALKK